MIDRAELAALFRRLSDEELQRRVDSGTLLPEAAELARAELKSRDIRPSMPEPPGEEAAPYLGPLTTVATFSAPFEANVLRARLEAEEIPAFVADEHLVGANWLLSNALGGVKVQVPRDCIPDAKAIIEAVAKGEYALEVPPEDDFPPIPTKCPRCSHPDIVQSSASWTRAFLAFFFLHIPLKFSRYQYKCKRCWHEWTPKAL